MDAKKLKIGMKVKFSDGNIVQVTGIGSIDRYGECFFSGILIRTNQESYKEYLNKDMRDTWNSAFCQPV